MRYLILLILFSVLSFSYGDNHNLCPEPICIDGVCASKDVLTSNLQKPSENNMCEQFLINDAFCKQLYGASFIFYSGDCYLLRDKDLEALQRQVEALKVNLLEQEINQMQVESTNNTAPINTPKILNQDEQQPNRAGRITEGVIASLIAAAILALLTFVISTRKK